MKTITLVVNDEEAARIMTALDTLAEICASNPLKPEQTGALQNERYKAGQLRAQIQNQIRRHHIRKDVDDRS